jgi:hypothetical protein
MAERPRRIIVNRMPFFWKADWRYVEGQRIILRSRALPPPGFDTDCAYPTPDTVRHVIEYGLTNGWNADQRSKPLVLSTADPVKFANVRPR